ncbi:hypothetical protein HYU92_01490 [Candidatus Curtissbacteria bacterium]|nr:hypothetical protein [Candidatus Curtissbacteria bacterium]
MDEADAKESSSTSRELEIEKIAGSADDHVAGSVFVKRIELPDLGVGTLVAVFHLKSKDSGDLQILGGDTFELVCKKIESSGTSVLEAVRLSTSAAWEYLSDRNLEVNFALVFFWDDACYISRFGSLAKILIFDSLISGGKQVSEEIKFDSGSGPTKLGQIYLVATEPFLTIFDKSLLSHDADLGELIDGVATEISAKKDKFGVAAALVRIKPHKGETLVGREEDESLEEAEKEEVLPKKQTFFKDVLTVVRFRRGVVILACLVLLILMGSVLFTLKGSRERENKTQFNSHFAAASSKYNEATALLELNRSKAREILVEADREVKLALKFLGDESAKKLESEIVLKLKETENTQNINFELLVEVDEPLSSLSVSDKRLWAVGGGKIFEIDPTSKSVDEIDSGAAERGFIFDAAGYLLGENKVVKIDFTSGKSEDLFNTEGAHDIAVFLGNIYLLFDLRIAKFVPVAKGYSETSYLEKEVELTQRSRFAIDGYIWVTSGKRIYKFLRGRQESFEISGLSGGGDLGAIFTNTELSDLYVIDVTNSALLVIGKDGIYKRAYQSTEFGKASDMVINESKRLYIVLANKILTAELE